jgi:hypothetical protein
MKIEIIKKNFNKDFLYLRVSNEFGECILRIDEKKYDELNYLLDNDKTYVGKQFKIQNNKRILRLR